MNKHFYEQKIKDIKIVSYARFNSSKSLSNRENYSILCISVLSFSLIALSVVNNNAGVTHIGSSWGNPITVWLYSLLASIFILILSVMISSKSYGAKSKDLYYSALKLNEIHRELELSIHTGDEKSAINLLSEYNKTIITFQENHNDTDWEIAKLKIEKPLLYKIRAKIKTYACLFYLTHTAVLIFSLLSMAEIFLGFK